MDKSPEQDEDETGQQKRSASFFTDIEMPEAWKEREGCRTVGMRGFLEGIHIQLALRYSRSDAEQLNLLTRPALRPHAHPP